MKIEFRKISDKEQSFEKDFDSLKCIGNFKKESDKIVLFNAKLVGEMESICDRCGDEFDVDIDEEISLKLIDGYSEEDDLDVIECFDSMIDFDEIINSEIESLKSDYHSCEDCMIDID